MTDTPIGQYRARMRRARLVYFAVLAVLVVLIGAGVAFAWTNGEIGHVSLHTVKSAPADLPIATPSQPLQVAWRTTDHAAIGNPQWRGTVVTYSPHTVRGRAARTGNQTWAYTRTDRTVCTAMQTDGITVAVYADNGNCDEVTALNSNTGIREWTRTLDEDGKPVNGTHVAYQVLTSTVVISTAQVIYAIDPSSGIDRWTWYHYGCTLHHVVLGSSGALISQTCTKAQNCNGHTMCGPGTQLLLRDGSAGYDDSNNKNPDQVLWNRFGDTDVPASADTVISALNPTTSALDTYDAQHGKSTGAVRLQPAPSGAGPIVATPTQPDELIWISGRIYAVSGEKLSWTAATDAPPTVVSTSNEDVPLLSAARVTAPVGGRIAWLNGQTGHLREQFSVSTRGSQTSVQPLGTGFLVATPSSTVAYR
jgi:outer membrane protein assembly factor BamB